MSRSTVRLAHRAAPSKPMRWLLAAAVAAGVALACWSWTRPGQEPAARPDAGPGFAWNGPGAPTTDLADQVRDSGVMNLTREQADQQLMEAARAVERQVGVPPATGALTERPAYVSELEWAALRQAAAQRPDSGKELTRMVNHLRFMKQLELWRGLSAPADASRRQAVAQALLDELPARVGNSEIERKEAAGLQAALLQDLVADPAERARRVEAEGKRLVLPAANPDGGPVSARG